MGGLDPLTGIVDAPVATSEYEAIANALRPHVVDGFLGELTFPQIVGLAAAAVAPTVESLKHERDRTSRQAANVAAESTSAIDETMAAARELVASITDAFAARVAEAEMVADRWRTEGEAARGRLVLLEAVRVQAEARWGHEGGPSPLRDALDAARPSDGG